MAPMGCTFGGGGWVSACCVHKLVSWCFEPSQPQRIRSGLLCPQPGVSSHRYLAHLVWFYQFVQFSSFQDNISARSERPVRHAKSVPTLNLPGALLACAQSAQGTLSEVFFLK